MKVVVLGLGKSGRSALQFLVKEGHDVLACDDKAQEVPEGSRYLAPDQMLPLLQGVDLVVISPGVPPSHPVAVQARKLSIDLYCDVELAFRRLAGKGRKMIGITGSNGKTTTTMLACHMLNFGKVSAKSVGNIGTPLLDEMLSTDTLVVELSSFQLETMKTAVFDAACILNITPNHLDRHTDFDEYRNAKFAIQTCIKEGGQLWLHQSLAEQCTDALSFGFSNTNDLYTDGVELVRFGKVEAKVPEALKNSLSHNMENFLAAYALCRQYDLAPEVCVEAYSTFVKPKHRIEFVKTVKGRHFYDDSKATSVEAVLRAVESLPNQIVLIAGGVHKGYPYTAWQKSFKDKVRCVLLIGKAAPFIEQDLDGVIETERCADLEQAVARAMQLTCDQDVILLSPGCSSYDMFTSYEERGKTFQTLVHKL